MIKLQDLSARLNAIADMVTRGFVPIDVGTDHAFLPIALINEGICPQAIATDLSAGACENAGLHIREEGLSDKISVFRRDGLSGYREGEADCLIISGMGGPLMIHILESSGMAITSFKEMILSPQSEIESVRFYLDQKGFCIKDERMVRDAGHDYVIMKVCTGKESHYSLDDQLRLIQFRYGPVLLDKKDPCLKDFLDREIIRFEKAMAMISKDAGQNAQDRLKELSSQKEAACRALKYLNI